MSEKDNLSLTLLFPSLPDIERWGYVAQWRPVSPNSTKGSRGLHLHHHWFNSLSHPDSSTVCRPRWACVSSVPLSIYPISCIFEASLSQFHANRTVFHTSVCMLACLVRPLICTCTINLKWASSNGKPADSNNSWIRYMRVIQLGRIDTGSSTCSPSVLLSAMETSLTNTNKHP